MATVNTNREQGAAFEQLFEAQARLQGLLVLHTPVAARYTYKGRLQAIKGPLDWEVVERGGRTAHLDTKCFSGERFFLSTLEPHQVERAAAYNDWGVPSGFVVYWSSLNVVTFHSGRAVRLGRKSFGPTDGVAMGTLADFDVRSAMRRPRATAFRLTEARASG